MANLLDAIRKSQGAAVQQPGVTDETQKVATLLRAKSGKAVGPVAGQSNLGEQAAVGAAQQAVQGVQQAGEIQNKNLEMTEEGQEQSNQLELAAIRQTRGFNQIENKLKTTERLNQFQQDKGRLNMDKDRAATQQFAQGLRLQNTKYLDNLAREGQKKRLDTDIGFQEELEKSMFGNSVELLKKNINNQSLITASDRDFQKTLAQMGIDDAAQMFREEKRAAAVRAPWEALGNISSTGAAAYGTYSEEQGKSDYYNSAAGRNETGYEASKYRKT